MIIDFNFPNLTPKGWRVDVHKAQKDGRIFIQTTNFENKEDAFAYYKQVQQIWRKQGRQK